MWSELIERRGQSGSPRSGGVASGTGEAKGPFGMKMDLSAEGPGRGQAWHSGKQRRFRLESNQAPAFRRGRGTVPYRKQGKASQSPESDWGCARAAGLQPAGRPSPTSGMG